MIKLHLLDGFYAGQSDWQGYFLSSSGEKVIKLKLSLLHPSPFLILLLRKELKGSLRKFLHQILCQDSLEQLPPIVANSSYQELPPIAWTTLCCRPLSMLRTGVPTISHHSHKIFVSQLFLGRKGKKCFQMHLKKGSIGCFSK